MKRFSLFLCFFIATSSWAATVYKKVNPDGSVEFTDKPAANTEEVIIRTPTTVPGHNPGHSRPAERTSDQQYAYQVQILKPANDEILVDSENGFTLLLSVSPVLKISEGDQFKVSVDGKIQLSGSKSVQLKNLPRGSHTIEVVVIDRLGVVMSDTASVSFHLKRYTQTAPDSDAPISPLNPPRPPAPKVSPTNPPKPPLPPVSPTRPPKP